MQKSIRISPFQSGHGLAAVVFLFGCIALLMVGPAAATAKTIHVDPAAATSGDGSRTAPYRSLEKALSAASGDGDEIVLADGFYGDLTLRNKNGLTLRGLGDGAVFSSLAVEGANRLTLKSLTVDWSRGGADSFPGSLRLGTGTAVKVDGSRAVVVDGLTIRSAEDGLGWSEQDWKDHAVNGIRLSGPDMVLRKTKFFFVRHAIELQGSKGVIEGNTVAHFSGDGIRAIGDFNLVQDNVVHSCYRVDDNHDDGFQSWSLGPVGRPGKGVTEGTVLRRNQFIETLAPGHPLQCRLQGIGMFDGIYKDWVIENNLVVVNHWHGITVMGADHVVIRNNSLINPAAKKFGPAGIWILPHKDGRQPKASLISNNLLARKAKDWPKGFPRVREGLDYLGNIYYGNPRNVFRDPDRFDFRSHPKSYGNDVAKGDVPADDLTGSPRPWGKAADVGAYEYRGD